MGWEGYLPLYSGVTKGIGKASNPGAPVSSGSSTPVDVGVSVSLFTFKGPPAVYYPNLLTIHCAILYS